MYDLDFGNFKTASIVCFDARITYYSTLSLMKYCHAAGCPRATFGVAHGRAEQLERITLGSHAGLRLPSKKLIQSSIVP